MPTRLKIGPYRFFFVALDRDEPPHIHVQCDDMVAKFWLDPIVLQNSGGFSRIELGKLTKFVQENKNIFLEAWNEFFND